MDNSTKRRLFLGFLSNVVSKFATSVIQLVQVPVFLHFWSVPLYGEWMIVTAIPTYLSLSNMGFGNVAGNEMTMMVARGEALASEIGAATGRQVTGIQFSDIFGGETTDDDAVEDMASAA